MNRTIYLFFQRHFYQKPDLLTYCLYPLSCIFCAVVMLRHWFYKIGVFKSFRSQVPIIVIGNIVVGGTGKTPSIIALANYLKAHGKNVGIISRGYGVQEINSPRLIQLEMDHSEAGDEPYLIALHTDCPVVISPHRVEGIKALLKQTPVDVILSDDGLQHYAMARNIEVVVMDPTQPFGNSFCLPAGPLREPLRRLKSVDYIVVPANERTPISKSVIDLAGPQTVVTSFQLKTNTELLSVMDFKSTKLLSEITTTPIHAITGIGNPERFFKTLRQLGLTIVEHAYPDHYTFCREDIDLEAESFIIMTEKDAVKCRNFSDQRHWFLPMHLEIDEKFGMAILDQLRGMKP